MAPAIVATPTTPAAEQQEVAAEFVGRRVQRQRVPHRPGKRRRGRLRYYTWASLCALSVGIGCGFRARCAMGFGWSGLQLELPVR